MAKGSMIYIGPEKLKELCKGTNLRPIDLERAFKVSHAGFYKWLAKGIIPVDKLGHLLALNKFYGYQIVANPEIEISGVKRVFDFKVKNFFGTSKDLFVETQPSDQNLEAVRLKINSFNLPITLLYLGKEGIKIEENEQMRRQLSGEPSRHGFSNQSALSNVSLDELIREIEGRGWTIKLERLSGSAENKTRKNKAK